MRTGKIEVFKKGRYGNSEGRIWSQEEVNQLQKNYDPSYRNAPVILGHNDWNGEKPAYGWVDSFEINDKGVLLANIEYNEELHGLVKDKKYTRVSIEATKKIELYDIGDKEGAYVLAVALLGGSQPAVPSLKPVAFSLEDREKSETLENSLDSFGIQSFKDVKKDDTITPETNTKEDKELEVTKEGHEKFLAEQAKLKEEQQKFSTQQEEFRKQQEEIKAEKEALAKKDAEIKLQAKKDDVVKFMDENSKRLAPTLKDEVSSFMVGLNDAQLDSFKKIITAVPETELFDNMEDKKEEKESMNTDEKFQTQAEKDIALAKS